MNLNKEKFQNIINNYKEIIDVESVGTLKEKTLHKIVKNYLEEDINNQEVKVGPYFVDIFKDGKIIEIQTRQFNTLRKKLEFLLKDYDVTICYPTFYNKTIKWINEDTHILEDTRKSPKKGSIYDAFFELYKIKQLLLNPRLKLKILLIDLEEYRLLNGWSKDKKRGSYRHDQIPVDLIDEVDILELKDYKKFIPNNLETQFTSKDYAKATKLRLKRAQIALNVLRYLDIIELVGKDSRLNLYSIKNKK